MSNFPITLNLMALIAATLAAFLLGALWYSPLFFGNKWFKDQGILPKQSREDAERMKKPSPHAIAVVFMLIVGYVLNFFLQALQATTVADALYVGFMGWLGFTAAIAFINTVYENRPFSVLFVHIAYCLAYIELMAVILTLWR